MPYLRTRSAAMRKARPAHHESRRLTADRSACPHGTARRRGRAHGERRGRVVAPGEIESLQVGVTVSTRLERRFFQLRGDVIGGARNACRAIPAPAEIVRREKPNVRQVPSGSMRKRPLPVSCATTTVPASSAATLHARIVVLVPFSAEDRVEPYAVPCGQCRRQYGRDRRARHGDRQHRDAAAVAFVARDGNECAHRLPGSGGGSVEEARRG